MKPARFALISLALITAIVATAHRAPAQYTGPYTDSMGGSFNNPISAQMSTMLWNRIFYPKANGNGSKSASSSSTRTTAPRAQPAPNKTMDESALRFRPTGTRITTRKLADQLGNTPAEREQYLKLMNAVLDGFDQRVKEAGLLNDIAIALSYFLAENARIYHGAAELSDQQYVDIRNVIAEALLTLDALNNITDRNKQEFYEGLVAYTGITQWGYEQSKQANNDRMAKLYQKVAGQNLQTVTKMSPDSINFTGNGLTGSSRPSNSDTTAPDSQPARHAIDIAQISHDYEENQVRANRIYKGKRLLFTGTVIEIHTIYKYNGPGDSTNLGPAVRLTRASVGVYCVNMDSKQMAQLRSDQRFTFEGTVLGNTDNFTVLIDGCALR